MFSYFILISILYICICQECFPGPESEGCLHGEPSDNGLGRVWLALLMGSLGPK